MQGDDPSLKLKDSDKIVFLASIRNPITRFISAYNFEKARNERWVQLTFPLFRRCFPNSVPIEEFLLDALSDDSLPAAEKVVETTSNGMNTSSFCKEVAINVTRGDVVVYFSHLTFNYQYYENVYLHLGGQHLLAVRSEFLERDFNNLESFLQNNGTVTEANIAISKSSLVNHTTSSTEKDENSRNTNGSKREGAMIHNKGKTLMNYTTISKAGYANLCRHLCLDIQTYKRFLYQAENLNLEMIRESISKLQDFCPEEGVEVRMDCDES